MFLTAALASFFNVVIFRTAVDCQLIKNKKGRRLKLPPFWRGRSVCDYCQKSIAAYDNIPLVSFLLLKGKCRHCDQKIPSRYFWTELLAAVYALVFVYLTYQQILAGHFPAPLTIASQFLFFLLLIFVALADFQYLIIPDFFVILLAFLALVLGFAEWPSGLIGVLVSTIFFAGLYFLAKLIFKKEAFGIGDIKLMIPLSFVLGWQNTLLAIFLSFIVGGFFATILLVSKQKKIGQVLPFGPFLLIAFVLSYFWADAIWAWYIGLLL